MIYFVAPLKIKDLAMLRECKYHWNNREYMYLKGLEFKDYLLYFFNLDYLIFIAATVLKY